MAWGLEKPTGLRGLHVHSAESGTFLDERRFLRKTSEIHVRGACPGQPELHPGVGPLQPKLRRHERRVSTGIINGKCEDRLHDRP